MSEATLEKPAAGNHLAGKYLTFVLGDESYGIPVLKIREIIRLTKVTPLPQMPAYICGVINLRGKIIPVMDLRVRLGFGQVANTLQTCIVVVQIKPADGPARQMGVVVDEVEEVTHITAAEIEATPNFGTVICTDYILGMAKTKGAVKALLDIDRVAGSAAAVLPAGLPAGGNSPAAAELV